METHTSLLALVLTDPILVIAPMAIGVMTQSWRQCGILLLPTAIAVFLLSDMVIDRPSFVRSLLHAPAPILLRLAVVAVGMTMAHLARRAMTQKSR